MKQPLTFDWGTQEAIYCSAETINQKIVELKKLEEEGKIRKIPYYQARNMIRILHTYCIATTKHSVVVRIYINSQDHVQYIFNENRGTSVSEEKIITGSQAYDYIDELFTSEHGQSMFMAFSGLKYKSIYNAIKACVPKPVSMINQFAKEKKISGVYKADVSSAYPSEGSKRLPTLHGCVQTKGRKEPTEEYPFAFYINSHHMKIKGELDTTEWCKARKFYTLYDEMFDDSVLPEDDITILCKESPCSMQPIFEEVYRQKNAGNATAKLGMNAAIGMFHKTNNPRLSHLAAVIIARCCDRIVKLAKKLEKQGEIILLIATDSIIWKGKPFNDATETKFLGSFTYEVHNGMFYGVGPKAYQILNEKGECITKYSGMKNGDEKNNIPFGKLPALKGTRRYMIAEDGTVTEVNWAI